MMNKLPSVLFSRICGGSTKLFPCKMISTTRVSCKDSAASGGGGSSDGQTVVEMRKHIMKICGASSTFSDHVNKRAELTSLLRQSQDELQPRTIDESRQRVVIPLSDEKFREKYLNTNGTIRVGQLLENLDSFSVLISYEHNSPTSSADGRSPYSIVTAMVDELQMYESEIKPASDVTMHGHVSWVGRSSLEISMSMTQHEKVLLDTKFLMVARDPSAAKAAVVHPLKVTTDEEQQMVDEGNRRKIERIETANKSLFSKAPTTGEMKLVHELFLSTVDLNSRSFHSRILPPNGVWMEQTKLKNAIVCFPENRNVHNKVFGGFIMRMAFELAWANASMFSKCRPRLKAIDDIVFHCPVPIGSILLMNSQICVVEAPYYLARVRAEVVDPATGESKTSNVFNFTFQADDGCQLPTVVPQTYGEAMVYLDGSRILKKQDISSSSSSSD